MEMVSVTATEIVLFLLGFVFDLMSMRNKKYQKYNDLFTLTHRMLKCPLSATNWLFVA